MPSAQWPRGWGALALARAQCAVEAAEYMAGYQAHRLQGRWLSVQESAKDFDGILLSGRAAQRLKEELGLHRRSNTAFRVNGAPEVSQQALLQKLRLSAGCVLTHAV